MSDKESVLYKWTYSYFWVSYDALRDHAKSYLANFGYSLKVRSLKKCNLVIYLDTILGILMHLKG